MYETKLGFREINRLILIDSHCILSDNGLVLLDTANDWRTRRHPLVTGSPHIRFYSGAHLVDETGAVIGVLAIFDSFPRMSFSEQLIQDLNLIAQEVMGILKTPYDTLTKELNDSQTSDASNSFDAEVKVLSMKLGRATSRDYATSVFEKDGSGNPYSNNSKLRLTVTGEYCKNMKGACLTEAERQKVTRKISSLGNLKLASESICQSIAISNNLDLACVWELRMADLYTIQREYLPVNIKKIDLKSFKHANKLVRSKPRGGMCEYFQARILGICGTESLLVDMDDTLLKMAFLHDFGVEYNNRLHNTKYNKGVMMAIHKNDIKLVRRARSSGDDASHVEVYLRYGGYLLGVFNHSSEKFRFSPTQASNIFDHASVLRRVYLV